MRRIYCFSCTSTTKNSNRSIAIYGKEPESQYVGISLCNVVCFDYRFYASFSCVVGDKARGIIATILYGGTIYFIGNFGLRHRVKNDVVLMMGLCCFLPFVTGVVFISLYLNTTFVDSNFSAIGFSLISLIPTLSICFVLMWFAQTFLKSRKGGDIILSVGSLVCCCFVFFHLEWYYQQFFQWISQLQLKSDIIKSYNKAISFLCMAMIILASNVGNLHS